MLLAELEVWHSRPVTPTRRVSLGHLVLPVDPLPGFGGLLLGAVLAKYIPDVDHDIVADVHRLLDQVSRGDRVVQPRLMHRYQVDRHGLAASVHTMEGDGDNVHFSLEARGGPLVQVLGAIYAVERLSLEARRGLNPVLHKALRWQGPIGPSFVANLAGSASAALATMADPRAWALEYLGFPFGTGRLNKKQVMTQFRLRLREVHPDHGAEQQGAAEEIEKLSEARRILLAASTASTASTANSS